MEPSGARRPAKGKIYSDFFQCRVRKTAAREQPRNSLREHPNRQMRYRISALADGRREVVAQVADKNLVHAHHQIQESRAVTKNDPEQFRRLGRRVEDRIDRDFELLRRSQHAQFCFSQLAPQFGSAMLSQLDKNFVLGFEVKVESPEADVGLSRDVCDPRLMISLARDDALRRLDQIEPSLLAPPIEPIRNLADLSCGLSHGDSCKRL